jgi:hypothetical protein
MMNIRKCKVEKNREWSASTQKRLAAALGVSALVSLTACDPVSTSGSVTPPDDNSSSSEGATLSSSDQETHSSSSVAPVSGVSSAFDDFPKSSSSVKIDSLEVTAGEIVPPLESSSSSARLEPPMSSSVEYPPLAGILPPDLPPVKTLSSSSQGRIESSAATAGLSSSFSDVVPQSSSSEPEPLAGDPVEIAPPLAGVIEDQPVEK